MKFWIYAFFSFIILGSCKDSGTSKNVQIENASYGIQDSIKTIIQSAKAAESTYENHVRVVMIRQELSKNPNNYSMLFPLAKELLNEGSTQEAINTIKTLFEKAPQLKAINDQSLIFHKFLAICYLRQGEQLNCQKNHTDESCIIPITGSGLYTEVAGSQRAIKKYLDILNIFPNDYQSQWLLNIANMTLGTYPDDVPKKWRIDISQKEEENMFPNVASFTGTDDFGLAGGVIADDFNNDGLLDLVVSSWGYKGKVTYYENHGNKGFVNRTEQSQLDKVVGGLNIKQADYNNDGHLDFIVLRGAWRPRSNWGILPNSLIKNNGDGTFSDVTIETNIYSTNPTQTAEWLDFNNDGNLDLFIANETTDITKENFPCELFENNGDGTFKEVAKSYNIQAIGYFKGCNSGDINNDGLIDMYLSNLKGDNKLYLNKGKTTSGGWSFEDISSSVKVTKPFASFSCWLMDIDNDGFEDISTFAYDPDVFLDLSGEFAKSRKDPSLIKLEKSKFYKNNGNLEFVDISKSHFDYGGLGTMGSNYGDINNDGYNEFYLGTGTPDYRSVVPNRFFANNQGKSFEDKSYSLGLGHIQKGHGISFADLDNDGDVDIYAVMGGAFEGDEFHNALFSNPGNNNDWIKIRLKGEISNRSAIGAKIKLSLVDGNNTKTSVYHKVSSGSSFGANPLLAHIGIPKDQTIDDVSVLWPNGSINYKSYGPLSKNTRYLISESGKPTETGLTSFEWQKTTGGSGHHHHH